MLLAHGLVLDPQTGEHLVKHVLRISMGKKLKPRTHGTFKSVVFFFQLAHFLLILILLLLKVLLKFFKSLFLKVLISVHFKQKIRIYILLVVLLPDSHHFFALILLIVHSFVNDLSDITALEENC